MRRLFAVTAFWLARRKASAGSTPEFLPPPGTTDRASVEVGTGKKAGREIKEWQAILHLSANDFETIIPFSLIGCLPSSQRRGRQSSPRRPIFK